MDREHAWRLVESARVATLATLRPDGSPRLVPCVFALHAAGMYLPVDDKPKRTHALARLADIEREPRVGVLVQSWSEDWSRLWWVRLDGTAALAADEELEGARARLLERYPQYIDGARLDPVIAVSVTSWTGWRADGA